MALNIKWIRKSTWELVIDWSTWEIFFSCAGIDSVTAILCATQRKAVSQAVSQTRLMPQANTSLRLDWNRKTGTQAGCDWPHARHTVVVYHLVCSFLAEMLLFMNLPEEMILSIFEYIAITERIKFRGVCKSWGNFWYTKHCSKILIFPWLLSLFRNVTWTSTCPIPLMSFCLNFFSVTLMATQR